MKKNLKIGFFPLHTFSKPGGVKNHVLALYKEFKKRGIESKIVVPRRKIRENYGKDIILLGSSFPFPFSGGQSDLTFCFQPGKIDKLLKEEKFDILHFQNFGVHSWQILEKSKVKNILTFHACLDLEKERFFKDFPWVLDFFKKIVKKKIDGIIGVSPFNLEIFKNLKKPMRVIPNGIDFEEFSPKREKIKKYLDGKFNLLFLGRIEERKGLIFLLKAFKILKPLYQNLRLIVVGEGKLKKECQNWVKENKLKDIIFEGEIKEKEKPLYYASCDIFISPAIFGESFGIVLLEAMASGKPVVAFSNLGYQRVLVGKGKEFLVKPKDWQTLAKKIEILIKDEKKRKEMAEWGQKEAQKYSWSKIAEKVLDFYQLIYEKS
jgi:phosphatidylinositol alpha-mannosyltransferase